MHQEPQTKFICILTIDQSVRSSHLKRNQPDYSNTPAPEDTMHYNYNYTKRKRENKPPPSPSLHKKQLPYQSHSGDVWGLYIEQTLAQTPRWTVDPRSRLAIVGTQHDQR